MAWGVPVWTAIGAVTAAATRTYVAIESTQQAKSARKEGKKQQATLQQRQLQAGEYWEELNREQMELQSQASQIKLLSDVITSKRQNETEILRLPAAKTYTTAERINSAIDDFVKGRA